jgi:hypothetical protein
MRAFALAAVAAVGMAGAAEAATVGFTDPGYVWTSDDGSIVLGAPVDNFYDILETPEMKDALVSFTMTDPAEYYTEDVGPGAGAFGVGTADVGPRTISTGGVDCTYDVQETRGFYFFLYRPSVDSLGVAGYGYGDLTSGPSDVCAPTYSYDFEDRYSGSWQSVNGAPPLPPIPLPATAPLLGLGLLGAWGLRRYSSKAPKVGTGSPA